MIIIVRAVCEDLHISAHITNVSFVDLGLLNVITVANKSFSDHLVP